MRDLKYETQAICEYGEQQYKTGGVNLLIVTRKQKQVNSK